MEFIGLFVVSVMLPADSRSIEAVPRIELVQETGQVDVFDSLGPFGAKGIGESGIVATVATVGNTFYHATGLEMNELPLSPERILKALDHVRSESSK